MKNLVLLNYAHGLMEMYKYIEKVDDGWEKSVRQQRYRTGLERLKNFGVVKNYDLSNGTIIFED